jgi:flagellar assembly protein FliH
MPSYDRIIPGDLAKQFVAMKLPSLTNKSINHSSTDSAAKKNNASNNTFNQDSAQIAYKRGYSDGYHQAEQDAQTLINARTSQLEPILKSVCAEVNRLKGENANLILKLAMALAEQIVRAEIKTNATAILPVIQESMLLISDSVARINLYVHPDDAAVVRHETEGENSRITIIEDRAIAPGGCRIITSQGDIDATLMSRTNAARIALGLKPVAPHEQPEQAINNSQVEQENHVD